MTIRGAAYGHRGQARRVWSRGQVLVMIVLAAVAAAGVGAAALAAIPNSSNGLFNGCYSKTTGALRLIDASKGQKCKTGEAAVSWVQGMTWRGTWHATASYKSLDVVSYQGASYVANGPNSKKPPTSSGITWSPLAEAGAQGPAGQQGPQGSPGQGGLLPGQLTLGVAMPVVLRGGSFGFSGPQAIAFDGSHLWITNANGNSVTEISASDGSWVRTLSGGNYGFSGPQAIAFDGSHLWVTNPGGDSVTEMSTSDGSWVRTLSGGSYGFGLPEGIAFDGSHLWIANIASNSVTEANASDGSWVRTLSGGSYGFSSPDQIAYDGTHLWITNNQNSVTEIDAANGSWVQTLSGSSYGFGNPVAVTFDGSHLWISNVFGDSLTVIQR